MEKIITLYWAAPVFTQAERIWNRLCAEYLRKKNYVVILPQDEVVKFMVKGKMEEEIWHRFPYLCSYCGKSPCSCVTTHPAERQKIAVDENKRPKTLAEFQVMFKEIYPSETRTLEHAGVHLAEELGEFSEAILFYRGRHKDADFERITLETADLFSCFMGIFNSIEVNVAEELARMFSENCHVCKKTPCECTFEYIMGFKF